MTVSQLAERLGVGVGNAKCLMNTPGFPKIRLGRQWLTDPVAFERWFANHKGETFAARSKAQFTERKRNQRGKYPRCSEITVADFY